MRYHLTMWHDGGQIYVSTLDVANDYTEDMVFSVADDIAALNGFVPTAIELVKVK